MNEEGVVSAWIGSASSRQSLDDALLVEFSEDGDFLGSEFSRAFNIGYYDESLKESDYRADPALSLHELLAAVSYADAVIPRLQRLAPERIAANCFVLLYNYRHTGSADWSNDGLSLRYIGTVSYT